MYLIFHNVGSVRNPNKCSIDSPISVEGPGKFQLYVSTVFLTQNDSNTRFELFCTRTWSPTMSRKITKIAPTCSRISHLVVIIFRLGLFHVSISPERHTWQFRRSIGPRPHGVFQKTWLGHALIGLVNARNAILETGAGRGNAPSGAGSAAEKNFARFNELQRCCFFFFPPAGRADASGSSHLRFRHNRAAPNISRLVSAHVRSWLRRIRRVIACAPMSTMHTRNSRALYSADVPRINFAAVGANMNISEISTRAARNPRGNPDGMRELAQFSGWRGKSSPGTRH